MPAPKERETERPDSYASKEHDGKAENAAQREQDAVQAQLDRIDKGQQPSDYQGESKLFRRGR